MKNSQRGVVMCWGERQSRTKHIPKCDSVFEESQNQSGVATILPSFGIVKRE